jgi:ubiquinone/menaquinone biosynthesis C-methylase UbiE
MDGVRKPFQGVWNIVRFNWHFYLVAFGIVLMAIFANGLSKDRFIILDIAILLILLSTVLSLVVSYYIYDLSGLYQFNWLDTSGIKSNNCIVNINAGFDETSLLIRNKFPEAELRVFDFYDHLEQKEVSIVRAKKAYPPYPGTQHIASVLPLANNSVDIVFVILSLHEFRQKNKRIIFSQELARVLKPQGKLIVIEHLRDTANFLAFNVGYFHFYSRKNWFNIFDEAGLIVEKELKITPFISSFVITKNGISH